MPEAVVCACGQKFAWKPELAGKRGKCKCGAVVSFPALSIAELPVVRPEDQAGFVPNPVVPPPLIPRISPHRTDREILARSCLFVGMGLLLVAVGLVAISIVIGGVPPGVLLIISIAYGLPGAGLLIPVVSIREGSRGAVVVVIVFAAIGILTMALPVVSAVILICMDREGGTALAEAAVSLAMIAILIRNIYLAALVLRDRPHLVMPIEASGSELPMPIAAVPRALAIGSGATALALNLGLLVAGVHLLELSLSAIPPRGLPMPPEMAAIPAGISPVGCIAATWFLFAVLGRKSDDLLRKSSIGFLWATIAVSIGWLGFSVFYVLMVPFSGRIIERELQSYDVIFSTIAFLTLYAISGIVIPMKTAK